MGSRPRRAASLARGLLAGLGGTAVMSAWQEAAAKLQSSGGDGGSSSSAAPQTDEVRWQQASAPAKVGKQIIEGVTGRPVPASRIGLLTNVMHWGYGTGWGAVYGLVHRARPRRPLRVGVAFGTFVWAMSYVQLVPMGLYEPPWKYDAKTLALDWSYHGAYGLGLGATHTLVAR